MSRVANVGVVVAVVVVVVVVGDVVVPSAAAASSLSSSLSSSSSLLKEYGVTMHNLNADDLLYHVRLSKHKWAVVFTHPRAAAWREFRPTWERLALVLDDDAVQVGVVDCDVQRVLCERWNVATFPTVKLLHERKAREYDGPLQLAPLKRFVDAAYLTYDAASLPSLPTEKLPIQNAERRERAERERAERAREYKLMAERERERERKEREQRERHDAALAERTRREAEAARDAPRLEFERREARRKAEFDAAFAKYQEELDRKRAGGGAQRQPPNIAVDVGARELEARRAEQVVQEKAMSNPWVQWAVALGKGLQAAGINSQQQQQQPPPPPQQQQQQPSSSSQPQHAASGGAPLHRQQQQQRPPRQQLRRREL